LTNEADRTMRTTSYTIVALICMTTVQIWAADPAPTSLTEIVKTAQAVAYVRVTRASEALHDDQVQRTATLTVCGRSAGLEKQNQLEIFWDVSAKDDRAKPDRTPPVFVVGNRCVVLLANRDGHWEAVHQLNVSPEGKLLEEGFGADLGLQSGIDADAAVQLIEKHLKNADRRSTQRVVPPPPSARNQPWKLMRASPLRRIWPFFPH
jgi:hypothetical protein